MNTIVMVCILCLLQTLRVLAQGTAPDDPVQALDWSKNGKLAIGYGYGSVQILSEDGQLVTTLSGSDSVISLAWNPDGNKLAFAGANGELWIWDALTGQTSTINVPDEYIHAVTWNPDGSSVAVATQDGSGPNAHNRVEMWNVSTGQLTLSIEANIQDFYLNSIAWSPTNNQLAGGSSNGVVVVWNTQTGQSITTLYVSDDPSVGVTKVAWKFDGSKLAAATTDGVIWFWNTSNWQSSNISIGGSINDLVWSPDGNVAIANYKTIKVLNPDTGAILNSFISANVVNSVAWSRTGKVAYGGYGRNTQGKPIDIVPNCAPPAGTPTITVAAGDTAGLIAAINTANQNANADIIALAANSTYTLTAVNNTNSGPNGLPAIHTPITIFGNCATITRSSSSNFRLFFVDTSGNLNLQDLTLSNGNSGASSGGAIRVSNGATLTVNESVITGNSSGTTNGGGILNNYGSLTVTNSTVSNNVGSGLGGGIWNNNGATTLTNTTFNCNSLSSSSGNGGNLYNGDTGTMTVTGGVIGCDQPSLVSARNGGGLFQASSGLLSLTDVRVQNNRVSNNGGGLFLAGDMARIRTSTFSGNTAAVQGGAIASSGTLDIATTVFTGNTATTVGAAILSDTAGANVVTTSCFYNTNTPLASTLRSNTAGFNAMGNWWQNGSAAMVNSNVNAANPLSSCPSNAGAP